MGENNNISEYGHFLQVNGINMYYLDCGAGYPVVLLHGGTGTGGTTWSNYIPILSQHYRIIVPDNRGRGKTNNPLQKLSYRTLAEDIIALCKALSVENPIICGWSDGGQTALEIAAHFPDCTKAIIAGGVISEITENYKKNLREIGIISPGNVDFKIIQEKIPGKAAHMQALHTTNDDPEYWKTLLTQLSHLWSDSSNYLGDKIADITIPTLIGIGDRDGFLIIEEIVAMFRSIPKVEFCVLPNTGHSIMSIRTAKLLCSVLIDFIERNV